MRTWILSAIVTLSWFGAGRTAPALAEPSPLWTDVDSKAIVVHGKRDIVPAVYRTLRLDRYALDSRLSQAPLASHIEAPSHPLLLEIPLPEGAFGRFEIVEAPILESDLAVKYPELRTYRGQGLDDPSATARIDVTPAGFHALVLSASGSVWIDPYQRGDTTHYIAYRGRDLHDSNAEPFVCTTASGLSSGRDLAESGLSIFDKTARRDLPAHGDILRTYRIAIAAPGEYTAFHSAGAPTVAEGLAAIVTGLNRVNAIYERSLSITLQLVANNDLIVYTDSATDPYSNGNNVTMLFENEANLNSVIGSANYDIGHALSNGGGGVVIGPGTCNNLKARGVSGESSPIGDAFWVRLVAHEIGHQFAADHTFNGNSGACSGNNQLSVETAYEPGSGSTILSYAGLCSGQNLQSTADGYYHSISLEEIVDYVTTGDGSTCGTQTATGNGIPVVDAGAGHTIPIETPFELCGSATDPDGHPMTFAWEQFNLGPTGPPDNPVLDAPIFRSWPPTDSPCRTFPRLQDLVAGTTVLGELLPTYARTLTFRLTARDNQASGGAVAADSVEIAVTDQAGPFAVTSTGQTTWTTGLSETITWDVAGTQLAPVNCSQVDLRLSTDGGVTFPRVLVAGTANDGSQAITVPPVGTTEARVKVACSDNIFFNVSNQHFTIVLTDTLFADDFETGNALAWSVTVP